MANYSCRDQGGVSSDNISQDSDLEKLASTYEDIDQQVETLFSNQFNSILSFQIFLVNKTTKMFRANSYLR